MGLPLCCGKTCDSLLLWGSKNLANEEKWGGLVKELLVLAGGSRKRNYRTGAGRRTVKFFYLQSFTNRLSRKFYSLSDINEIKIKPSFAYLQTSKH